MIRLVAAVTVFFSSEFSKRFTIKYIHSVYIFVANANQIMIAAISQLAINTDYSYS